MSALTAHLRRWWDPTAQQRYASLGLLLFYTLVTLVVTWPVIAHLSDGIPGYQHGDQLQKIWSLWHTREAVLHGRNPAYFSTLVYPNGYFSPIRWAMLVIPLASFPLTLLFPPTATYNLLLLLSYVTTGYTGYLLCKDITNHRWASVLGGLLIMLFPVRVAHALAGHLETAMLFLPLLYMRALRRTLLEPTPRNALGAGVLLALSGMVHVTFLPYIIVPWTAVYAIHFLARRAPRFFDWRTWRSLLIMAGIAAIIVTPFFVPLVTFGLDPPARLMEGGTITLATDLLSYISPSTDNPLLNALGLIPGFAEATLATHPQELIAYLGIVPLLIAGLAIATRRTPETIVWLITGIIAMVLALGPYLKIGGEWITYEWEDTESFIVLPYALLTRLPLFNIGRTPGRFNLITGITLAILTAQGAAAWLESRKINPTWRSLAFVIAGIIIAGEYLVMWPLDMRSAAPPAAVQALREETPTGGVLNIPLSSRTVRHRAMFYQTFHHWPIMDGYVARALPNEPGMLEVLEWIPSAPDTGIIPTSTPDEVRALLAEEGIVYVILYRNDPAYTESMETRMHDAFGGPIASDETTALYRVGPAPVLDAFAYALSSWNWGYIETWNDQPGRWLSRRGDLIIYAPDDATGALTFQGLSGDFPRRLQVTLNGEELPPLIIGQYLHYILPDVTLQEGYNVVHFESLNDCWPIQGDARCHINWDLADLPPGSECWLGAPTEPERCVDVLLQDIRFTPDEQITTYYPMAITLGDAVQLRGFSLDHDSIQPDSPLTLTLVWQALDPIPEDYVAFVHLLDTETETLIAQHDGEPLHEAFPTSQWQPGDIVQEQITLQIPPDLPSGSYSLFAGMYRYPSLQRLPVDSGRLGSQDGLIWLLDVAIAAAD